ncbi:hypothetical protein CEP07_05605 [Cylindrospermopsis raciborskii S01]|nr:hypothetical protein CEP07_05605 [Cylindrospermopsis raciborskii S01]
MICQLTEDGCSGVGVPVVEGVGFMEGSVCLGVGVVVGEEGGFVEGGFCLVVGVPIRTAINIKIHCNWRQGILLLATGNDTFSVV